jgi:predicted methyltransferase
MVEIEPGIPHTWTACPSGVVLPDGIISEGQFLMVYEYSKRTSFYPTASIKPILNIAEYERYDSDLEAIRFPRLNANEVIATGTLIWNNQTTKDLRLAN